ncbi:AAA family ATPase [uncultured Amphritea sp.]|mgnify:CR=1 FL=1|uniref:AAA family ATPase n=1 Tax=uncultured Amphritea sp. TaxID=981605 RepID=UPI00262270FA|nr:AAA family ATPase [uncultured Amphritea sp.]
MPGQLILISGESASGKSTSLMNLPNQERWGYLNTESGKDLPFPHNFRAAIVTDPYEISSTIDEVVDAPQFDGVIIDSLTFMMDMFESLYIVGAKDGRDAWQQYAQFFKNLMQQSVAKALKAGKHVIFLAHTRTEQDAALNDKTYVPIKGQLANQGIEAYFSTVVSTKRIPLEKLEGMDPALLNITQDDEMVGYKHVFQTRLTKETVGERIRGPIGLFQRNQIYMDNDVAKLIEHMNAHFGV